MKGKIFPLNVDDRVGVNSGGCQGCWACLLFVVQRSSVGSERGVVVLDELAEEVLDEV